MGGADQWGNITAGLELIRRTQRGGERATARARPTASPTSCCSRRRGRSSARARAASRSGSTRRGRRRTRSTSTGCNTDDRDVGTYLRWFTEFPREEIEALEAEAAAHARGARPAQRALARDITARTHGAEAAARGDRRLRGAVLGADAVDDPAVARVAVRVGGRVHVRRRRGCAAGVAVLLAEAGRLRLARRGPADDRGRRRDGQRRARHGPGVRPGAHRRGVARRAHRQAPPRDRAPRGLSRRVSRSALGAWRRAAPSMTSAGGTPRSASSTSAW